MSNKYSLLGYAGMSLAGIVGWFYIDNQNKNMTVEEKYAKFGGDKRELVEQRRKNLELYAHIRQRAGIAEPVTVPEEEPQPPAKKFVEGRLKPRKRKKKEETELEEENDKKAPE